MFSHYVSEHSLASRISLTPGDFFSDPLPKGDVVRMGHILHDWSFEQRRLLIRKAYDALPVGGALIVYEAIIDDERRRNVLGVLSPRFRDQRGPVLAAGSTGVSIPLR